MTPRNSSVLNALRILRLVSAEGPALSLDLIARRLDLSRAAAHRLLTTLQEEGAILRLKRNLYAVGPGLAEIAANADIPAILAAVGRDMVRRLARELDEVVHLGHLERGMVTYLVKGRPRRKATVPTEEGTQLEAYSSGLGKVLLAHLPPQDLEDYLASGPFVAFTEHTITDPAAIRRALDDVKRQGFATDEEEVMPGLTCLAVPVPRPVGGAVAAFSVSGASERFTPAFRARARATLKAAADELSARLYGAMEPQSLENRARTEPRPAIVSS